MGRIINPCPNCGYGIGADGVHFCIACGWGSQQRAHDDEVAEAQRQAARVASIDMDKLYLDQLDFMGKGKAWETYMLQVLGLSYTRAGGLNAHG